MKDFFYRNKNRLKVFEKVYLLWVVLFIRNIIKCISNVQKNMKVLVNLFDMIN